MALQKKTTVRDIYANRTTKKKQEANSEAPAAKQVIQTPLTKNAGTSSARVSLPSAAKPNPALAQAVVQSIGSPSASPRSDSSGKAPAAKSLRLMRTKGDASAPESKSSAPSISIRSGAASRPSLSAAMKRGQTDELDMPILFRQPTTLERIALSARSGVKDWASSYMDYAAVGTSAENTAGKDITSAQLENLRRQAANEQAVIDSYERGEGVYDKADADISREQLANLQFYIDAYSKASGEQDNISKKTAAESAKVRGSAAEDMERATHGLGTVGQTLVRGVGSTTQNLLDLAAGGGVSALPSIGMRVYGQSAQEAIERGDSREKAVQIGLARAAAELIPEGLSGGNPLTSVGGGRNTRLRQALDAITSSKYVNNFVTQLGVGAFGEGAEEVITQGLNDVISAIAYGDEADLSSPKEYAEAFWGGVVGGLYGNIVNPAGVIKNAQQDVDDIARNSAQRAERAAAAQAEQASIDSSAQNAAQGAAGAGGITTGEQAVQGEGGVLNAPQSAQAEQAGQSPRQTTLDIYQNRGTRQAESTVVDTDPTTHTAAQQEIINDYQGNVDEGLVSFANRVRTLKDGNYRNKITYSISEVSPRQTQDIKAITGVDTTGFENIITGDAVTHIDSRHGVDGEHDHSMADTNDLARIGYVLDNYDSVVLATNADGTPRTSGRWRNRDGSTAAQVIFKKKIGGTMYVVEAVPDSKRSALAIVSAYIQKNSGSNGQVLNIPQSGPQLTSETPVGSSASAVSNITQGETAVNSESQGVESLEQLAAEYTERYNRAREIEQSGGDISQEEKAWLSGTLQRLLDMQQVRGSDRLALIGEERARNGETSKGRNTEANHIDNRTEKDMASQQTKAFSFDHPELHPYFVEAAKVLREDVGEALSSDYTKKTQNGGYYLHAGKPTLADGLDGISRPDIIKACDNLIEDNGQENYAVAKRVERRLDDMLTNGYYYKGEFVQPDSAYIEAKGRIVGGHTESELRAKQDAEADDFMRALGYGDDGLGAANAGFDPVSRWQESAGRYHPVNEAAAQTTLEERGRVPTDVPVTDAVGGQVSKHVSTLVNANITTNEMAAALMEDARKGAFSAQPYTDAEAAAKVREHIEQVGWDVVFGEYRADIMRGKASKDISMTGIVLYNNAVNAGALLDAMDVAALMARNSRNVAQAQQVLSVINKLSPESQLYFSIRGLQNLVEQAKARYGKRAENLTVDETLVSEYKDALMRGDEEAAAAVWDQITLDVAQQIPSNFAERLNNWRYLAMLGNPRTHVRNLAGNAGFAPVRITRNLISTGIQAVVLDKANRQRAFINFANKDNAALFRAAADYYGEVVDSIQSGGKYSDAIDEVDAKRGIFRSGALESIRKANSRALDVEDTWFSRPAFAYALASYMKANGITADELNSSTHSERLTHGIEYAVKEAQKATYRDSNAFSDWVASLGKNYHGDNKAAKAANLAVEAALPFKRTPANIVVRGVEYSPVGLVKGLTYDLAQVQKGNMTAADAIDNISSGITGTALLGLGLYLASQALLSGGDDPEDKKQNWFNDLMGYQNYALNVGGKSYTIDWLAPGAMPIFVGAELWKAFSSKNMSLTDALDAISRVTNPMIETSMLSSVNDLLESVANAQTGKNYIKAIESLAASYLSQYIPTLGGQLERTIEDKRYETYRYGDTGALGLAPGTQNQIGKALNKIPGVEFNQIPYIDAWGREEGSGNIGTRIFNNFFNPSYVSDIQRGKVEDELQRLYDANYTNVLPDRPAQSTKIKELGGEYMTANEYVKYARTRGSESLKLISAFLDSDYYKGLSDDQRAQVIGELYALANDEAKRAVVTGRGLSYESDYDKYDSIGDPALYMSMRAAMKQLSESEGRDNEAFKAVYAQWRTLPPKGRAMYTDGVEGQFDGISTLKKLDNCLQAGMSTQQFYEAKAEYRALSDNDSLGATARRAAFAHWLDTESGFTPSARTAALENFSFTTTLVADEGKYEQMASSGVGNAASERIFNSIQQLQPESGNKTVSDLQRYEAITASGASESEQLAALRVYASDSQIEYFQAAFDNGIALGKWTAVLRSVRESETGNMSQGNLVRAMYENGIPNDKARAMYNVYKAKHHWRSSYEQAYANAW